MKNAKITQALKSINKAHRDAIVQLILVVANEIINKYPEIKTIGFGASYEYNDEGYDYNYRLDADDIEINGYNIWQLEEEDEDFFKKKLKIESRETFDELVEYVSDTFSPFDGELHHAFGKNFKLVISKDDVKIIEDEYD